jgi:tetratricopeptide (TPR) repeat protein
MDVPSLFLIYVTVFRLAIVGVGALAILLGYRLFCRYPRLRGTHQPDELNAKFGAFAVALRHAGPGTAFALFGTTLIVAVFVQGNPQLTLDVLDRASVDPGARAPYKLTLRGNADTVDTLISSGVALERQGDSKRAIEQYERSTALLALPMNQLAVHYLAEKRTEEALALARLAATLSPRNGPVLDTLAQATLQSGNREEAIKWITRAAQYDPQFAAKVPEYRKESK